VADVIEEAVSAIRRGLPVVLPFDGVYGLCSSPCRQEPTARIYRLKGRDPAKPAALIASDVDMLFECVPELRGRAGVLARALLPGPYTLILPNPARRYPWLTGADGSKIGVRVPLLQETSNSIVERAGCLVATSANLAGGPEPRRLEDVPDDIRSACLVALDGGELPGLPSTVIDLTGEEPVVLREGAVPAAEALAAVARTG